MAGPHALTLVESSDDTLALLADGQVVGAVWRVSDDEGWGWDLPGVIEYDEHGPAGSPREALAEASWHWARGHERANPPKARGVFQRLYIAPARLPKWLRDGLKHAHAERGFTGAAQIWEALRREAARWPAEKFLVIATDIKNKPTAVIEVGAGILDASLVHPREVFSAAVGAGAASIIIAHNHPSGDPEPSYEDRTLTKRLVEAAELMGIPILDHIVLGRRGYVSFAERGEL